jgi:phosphatidate cytidylyltransferase
MPDAEIASGPPDAGGRAPRSNLAMRVISAAVLTPLTIYAAYLGGWPFAVFWAAAAIAVLWEWTTLVAGPGNRLMFSSCASALAIAALLDWRDRPVVAFLLVGLGALAALIFAPRGRRLWITGGIAYSGTMLLAPMLLRDDDADGFFALALLFAVVWTTDVLGYFVGRAIGGPKLAPSISPKKTWSGAVAGTLGAIVVAVAVAAAFRVHGRDVIAVLALLLSVTAQLGDLFESWVKRQFGAKDASNLVPGHGGVMDRLDGFWAAAVLACAIGLARGGIDGVTRGLLVW